MKRSLVITDVTRMSGSRVCVAGYDVRERRCVRPVLRYSGVYERSLYYRGRIAVFPAAQVEFAFERATPRPPHMEDMPYVQGSIRFIQRLTEDRWRNVLEATMSESVDAIFGQPILADPGHYVIDGQGTRSLGTICPHRITEVRYRQREDNGTWDYRLGFDDARGTSYRLKVTDLSWRYFLDHKRTNGHTPGGICGAAAEYLQRCGVFLRIGLARGWDKYPDRCYLQITGIHTFPDYLKGRTFADFAP